MAQLVLHLEGELQVVATRLFAAVPEAVYRAHTDPELLQQWLLGPEGWSMPVCQMETWPGGNIRFEWSDGKGSGFHLTGEVLAVDPNKRIVHVERMFLPDRTPDNHVETTFTPHPEGTLLTLRMTLPSAEARTGMLASGMEHGMEDSYARMERTVL